MPTYVYETLGPSKRTFEVKQSMKDAALTTDPETGEPVRRVISGGYGLLQKAGAGPRLPPAKVAAAAAAATSATGKTRAPFAASMSTEAATPGNPAQQFSPMLARLIGSHQWDRALDVAREWLAQDPESPDAHLAAAQALVNLQRFSAAETHVVKALAARPTHGFAHRLASIVFFHQQKPARADEHIQRAIELQPMDATHWYHLAWMRYRQGSLTIAEKHARRALELQPESADTLNLIAICQRGNPSGQREQYLRALEIDPENAVVHNNLGTYYLNSGHDFAAAEACFRQALRLNPMDPTAQKNLFAVLRARDPIYRLLTWPRTLIYRSSWSKAGRPVMTRIALLLLWLAMGRYILIVFAFWLILVLPLVKVYETLTLGDLRAKAGVIGARRGGWLGYHRWPLHARFAIFALLAVLFWGGLFWLYESGLCPPEWIAGSALAALIAVYSINIPRWWKRWRGRAAARAGEKKFRRIQAQEPP